MATRALSLMVITNSKRRSTFLLDTRPSFANSSMRAPTVLTETDASSSTRPSWMKFNKRNKLKMKIQVIAQWLISSCSWAINKCWTTISSALSKDLLAHRTLTWMNSIWFTKMLSKDCQFSKPSPQILQSKMSNLLKTLPNKGWSLILKKNMLSLRRSCN